MVARLASALVLVHAVQLNVVQQSGIGLESTAQVKAIPLSGAHFSDEELANADNHDHTVAGAISSSLFAELAKQQDERVSLLQHQNHSYNHHSVSAVYSAHHFDDPSLERGRTEVSAEGAERGEDLEDEQPTPGLRGGDALLEAKVKDSYHKHKKASKKDREGYVHGQHTYKEMAQSVQTTPTADIGLLSVRDTQYMGWIRVGSQVYGPPDYPDGDGQIGIPMRVVFDTGSTNLWVTGSKCSKRLPAKYIKESSGSWHHESRSYMVHIKFGTGSLNGPTAKDDVRIGPFMVPNQIFGVIEDEVGNIFKELDDFGGILGLGHRDMSMASPEPDCPGEDCDGHVTPVFHHLFQSGQISVPEFSMYMNAEKKRYSAILFGGVDARVVQPPREGEQMFQMARVRGRGGADHKQPHYWSTQLYRIVYNKCPSHCAKCDTPDKLPQGDPCTQVIDPQTGKMEEHTLSASFQHDEYNPTGQGSEHKPERTYGQNPDLVFDSGTTLYTGPQLGVDEILEWIKPVRCGDLREKIGTVTYEVQGLKDPAAGDHVIDITLQPHQFMVHDGGQSGSVDDMNCRPGFWTINVPEPNGPAWLLGELFMRHFVTVYRHHDSKRAPNDPPLVAWAPSRQNPQDAEREAFIKELDDHDPRHNQFVPTASKVPDQEQQKPTVQEPKPATKADADRQQQVQHERALAKHAEYNTGDSHTINDGTQRLDDEIQQHRPKHDHRASAAVHKAEAREWKHEAERLAAENTRMKEARKVKQAYTTDTDSSARTEPELLAPAVKAAVHSEDWWDVHYRRHIGMAIGVCFAVFGVVLYTMGRFSKEPTPKSEPK